MPLPDWYPDELAHAGPEHLDAAYVATYEQKAGFDPAADIALLRARGLNESNIVVDLGAGTGGFALAVAPYCRQVIAVDISPAMIRALEQRASAASVTNLRVVRAGFLSYEHAGPPADVVYSRHALHHLPDFWKVVALQRIAAMLRPGGLFRLLDLVYAFSPEQITGVVEEWLAGAAPDASQGWTRAEYATHLREEYSTFSWLLEPMLTRTGFVIDEATDRFGGIFAAYTCHRAE